MSVYIYIYICLYVCLYALDCLSTSCRGNLGGDAGDDQSWSRPQRRLLEQCKRLPHPGPGRENLPGDAAVEADLALDRPRFILGPWTSLQ